jgi:hypothetical protein
MKTHFDIIKNSGKDNLQIWQKWADSVVMISKVNSSTLANNIKSAFSFVPDTFTVAETKVKEVSNDISGTINPPKSSDDLTAYKKLIEQVTAQNAQLQSAFAQQTQYLAKILSTLQGTLSVDVEKDGL